MKKRNCARTISFLLCVVSLGVPCAATAAVTITEAMYNPAGSDTGREWIELHNSGSEAVEVSAGQKGWRINDGANHVFGSNVVIPPGGFVIVASNPVAFAAQYGSGLLVVKSALSLNNAGGTLSLLDAEGKIVDTVSYTKSIGGLEDGMSLHRVGSGFAPGTPNPGVAPAPGVPKSASPAQKTTASTAAAPKIQQKKTVVEQSARAVDKSELPAAAAAQQSTHTGELDSPVGLPKQGGFLWHYVLALTALVVLGVASVWYIRAEKQAKQYETPASVDEFDIE